MYLFLYNRCGHDGIIHGGLAATVLDEMLAYVVSVRSLSLSAYMADLIFTLICTDDSKLTWIHWIYCQFKRQLPQANSFRSMGGDSWRIRET